VNEFFKAVRSFITDYLPKQKRCSPHTIRSYRLTLNLLVSFLREKKQLSIQEIDFNILTRDIFVEFLEWLETERRCSASSRNQRLAALRSFFNYAGIIDCVNAESGFAVSSIPRKNVPGRVVGYLSEPALEALLRQPDFSSRLGLRNGFFMILMYDTAARCDELLHLKLRDVHADAQHPTVYLTGKPDKTRIVPLMEKTAAHYKRYLQTYHPQASPLDDTFVFYTVIHGNRSAMSPDTPAKFIQRYGELAGKGCSEVPARVHPHMLRHTRAIHLYRNGMPLELVSQFLGHSNVDTSRIYAYADTEMKRAAIKKADKMISAGIVDLPPMWENNEDMILRLSGLR